MGRRDMKKLGLILAAAAMVAFAGSAMAQSAKFSATWSDDEVLVSHTDGTGAADTARELDIATIHVASQKDLLIGVSAEIAIVTFTEVKGKGGDGKVSSKAEGSVDVTLALHNVLDNPAHDHLANDDLAVPGAVTLAARLQELSLTNLNIEDITIGLKLATKAAHHFNFLGIDLEQGTYDVIAVFDLSAFTVVCGNCAADAEVVLDKRVLTVQEVRAVRGGIIEDTN